MKALISVVSFILLLATMAIAAQDQPPTREHDAKGNVFIIIQDPARSGDSGSSLQQAIAKLASDLPTDLELIAFDKLDHGTLAKKILALPDRTRARLGGIIELAFESAPVENDRVDIAVYHYPFASITHEHITSPEYTFKFGSDSALLAIHLQQALSESDSLQQLFGGKCEITPATDANPYLPGDLLRKYVRATFRTATPIKSSQCVQIAELIGNVFNSYINDTACHVIGLLPPKVRRHARTEDVEIRLFKYLYPDQEFSEQQQEQRRAEMAEPIEVLKPFASDLYYISSLDHLTPYTIEFIDPSKPEDYYWHDIETGSFVTSSVGGIVRTVPGLHENYVPLEYSYEEAEHEPAPIEKADYVIAGATVFDGTRDRDRYIADVAIAGEKIVAVGDLQDLPRNETIDGDGLFLTPGFIDIHSHVDENVLEVPYGASHIRQGITTVLGGNCSFSPLGIGEFHAKLDRKGSAVNIGELVGNRPVRERVLGERKGMPSYAEVYREKELVDLAMEEGAFGMSSGLIYKISEEAFAWELAELAKQLKPYGGFYASHIRGETDEVIDAAREAIYIGEIAEVPVQISHMKVLRRRNWGDMDRYLDVIRQARQRGLNVTGDQYPWRASGPAAHYRLHKLLVREAIRNESPEVVLLKDMPGRYAAYSGRPLTELLAAERMTPEQLIEDLSLTEESDIFATYLCIGERDVCRPMKEDFVMVCTDSSLAPLDAIEKGEFDDDHPRKFRTFPEFFGNYVRDKGVCSWELGVYKCTGLPAWRMKLTDRGVIKPGAFADLVLFDPEKINPGTDYRNQRTKPQGVKWVFINGRPALREGELTRIRSGRNLRAYNNLKP